MIDYGHGGEVDDERERREQERREREREREESERQEREKRESRKYEWDLWTLAISFYQGFSESRANSCFMCY